MSKVELRREFRNRRSTLPPELVEGWSAAIVSRLTALDEFLRAEAIHCYASSLPGEVQTDGLIERSLHARKQAICPRVRAHGQLEHHEVAELSHLVESTFGLREPDPELAAPVDPGAAELIVIPGVAFTPSGMRLGMGGGYYDRFLSEVSATIVGLAYEMQIVDLLPHSPHDQRVHMIVTELRVIRCR